MRCRMSTGAVLVAVLIAVLGAGGCGAARGDSRPRPYEGEPPDVSVSEYLRAGDGNAKTITGVVLGRRTGDGDSAHFRIADDGMSLDVFSPTEVPEDAVDFSVVTIAPGGWTAGELEAKTVRVRTRSVLGAIESQLREAGLGIEPLATGLDVSESVDAAYFRAEADTEGGWEPMLLTLDSGEAEAYAEELRSKGQVVGVYEKRGLVLVLSYDEIPRADLARMAEAVERVMGEPAEER